MTTKQMERARQFAKAGMTHDEIARALQATTAEVAGALATQPKPAPKPAATTAAPVDQIAACLLMQRALNARAASRPVDAMSRDSRGGPFGTARYWSDPDREAQRLHGLGYEFGIVSPGRGRVGL